MDNVVGVTIQAGQDAGKSGLGMRDDTPRLSSKRKENLSECFRLLFEQLALESEPLVDPEIRANVTDKIVDLVSSIKELHDLPVMKSLKPSKTKAQAASRFMKNCRRAVGEGLTGSPGAYIKLQREVMTDTTLVISKTRAVTSVALASITANTMHQRLVACATQPISVTVKTAHLTTQVQVTGTSVAAYHCPASVQARPSICSP